MGSDDGSGVILGVLTWQGKNKEACQSWPYINRAPEPKSSDVSKEIRSVLGMDAKTLPDFQFLSWTGAYDFLQIPLAYRHKAAEAIEVVRRWGYCITLQTKLRPRFEARFENEPYVVFCKENSEKLAVEELRDALDKRWESAKGWIGDQVYWYGQESLWCTSDGKKMARALRELFPEEKILTKEPWTETDGDLPGASDEDFPPQRPKSTAPGGAAPAASASSLHAL